MFSLSGDAALVSRFLAGGAFNTAFGLAVIFLLMAFGVGALAANVCGYASGLLLSFTVNRRFVFRATGAVTRELPRYMIAFVSSFLANLVTLHALTRYAHVDPFVGQLLAISVYVLVMFILCRAFVFRDARR
jgi:putative flippase GtrA